MPGNVSSQRSNAPKRGAGASNAKKASPPKPNQSSSANPSNNSANNSSQVSENNPHEQAQLKTGAEDKKVSKEKDFKQYNESLNKYQNENKKLAFMKEENFNNSSERDDPAISISELNSFMAGEGSLAARINAAARGNSSSNPEFGSGRSRLPGDSSPIDTGNNADTPRKLPKNALTNSQLYLGYFPEGSPFAPKGSAAGGGSGYISRSGSAGVSSSAARSQSSVNSTLNGSNQSQSINFEAYTSSYLKKNAPELSKQFEGNPSFKSRYLNNVEKLYGSLDVKTLGNAPVEERTSKLLGQAGQASARDKLQVANSFMTLLAKNDSQIDKIAKSGLKVFMAESIVSQGEDVAGYFSTDNHMVLSRNPSFASFNATAVHELMHVVDFGDGSLDGRTSGLGSNWSQLRDNASQKINATGGNLPGIESNFANYSQSNDMEFLSVMTQLYQSDTQDMQRNFPEIFNTLDRMFRVA